MLVLVLVLLLLLVLVLLMQWGINKGARRGESSGERRDNGLVSVVLLEHLRCEIQELIYQIRIFFHLAQQLPRLKHVGTLALQVLDVGTGADIEQKDGAGDEESPESAG